MRPTAVVVVLAVCWCSCGGCQPSGDVAYERQLQALRERIADQQQELAARQALIDTLEQQLTSARRVTDEQLEQAFYPERLMIDKLSGGYDADDDPGDDGVIVYLKPLDAAGDVLKVAGEIRIQLYDLAAAPANNLVGDCVVPIERARELWHGKLWTYHYTVRCPWQHGPPAHREITIRATFIDFLTQRVLTDQATVTVQLPERS